MVCKTSRKDAALWSRFLSRVIILILLSATACSPGSQSSEEETSSPPSRRTDIASNAKTGPDTLQEKGNRPVDEEEPGKKYRTHMFDPNLTTEQRKIVRELEAIGYISSTTETGTVSGVTSHDRAQSFSGLNFYTSGHAPEAILMDMDGQVLHTWSYEFRKIWPDYPVSRLKFTRYWRRAYLFENGDILAIFEGLGIIKLDRDSNLIWANPGRAHHDLEVMPDGDIYVLTREAHMMPHLREDTPILEDFISVLGPDGTEKQRISLIRSFENSPYQDWLLDSLKSGRGDIFHTNTVAVLDGRIAGVLPSFRKGNVLTSMRENDTIAVIDLEQEQVVWAKKGYFHRQHDPKILENGNLLLFDNVWQPNASRVVEFDPVSMDPQWEYRGSPPTSFYSYIGGLSERLPNGNTLIIESTKGRALEVTPEGIIVWEFYNPNLTGRNSEYRATLFDMVRLRPDFPISWSGE